ncbi:MAG TPA: hypothetical protein VEQ11_22135 [Chloroflexota bacterium]|nr:hypothetical protein [Chloroflexota bacterium]
MSVRLPRREALGLLAQLGLGLAASACLPTRESPTGTGPAVQATEAPGAAFNPVLANSEIVKGHNRFAMGLIGEANRPITDARVRFGFFQINGQQATKRSEADATFRWVGLEAKGMYVATAQFDAPGQWGVEVTATRPGGAPESARVLFEVREKGDAPMIGTPATRSKTETFGDVKDPSEICSNVPPCPLHAQSLDSALANGRPSLVVFATPGYCVSATCAPTLGVVLKLSDQWAGRANFIHVEIYKDPRNQVLASAVTEWNLPSEPWVFLVDRSSLIADRFEGIVTPEELEPALQAIA